MRDTALSAPDMIRLVLGFSPGSASDQVARALAGPLARALNERVEVVLKPGHNGAPAAVEVACSPADGRTLFMATLGTHALAPHLNPALPYDPLADFEPVSLVASGPLVLACHPALAATSTAGLIALARQAPATLTYGTSALGGAPHLAAALFEDAAGVEMRHVRYDHTERLYGDLEAGRIAVSFNNIMSMLPRCRRGALRALAVTSAARSPSAPELPAIAEAGLSGYDVANWLGVVAPKATRRARIDTLSRAFAAAVRADEVESLFAAAGLNACGGTPEAFAHHIAREWNRWRPVAARLRKEHA